MNNYTNDSPRSAESNRLKAILLREQQNLSSLSILNLLHSLNPILVYFFWFDCASKMHEIIVLFLLLIGVIVLNIGWKSFQSDWSKFFMLSMILTFFFVWAVTHCYILNYSIYQAYHSFNKFTIIYPVIIFKGYRKRNEYFSQLTSFLCL